MIRLLRRLSLQLSKMLLCIVYALCGTDFHSENMIASGDQPVLVDLETLLTPGLPESVGGPKGRAAEQRDELAAPHSITWSASVSSCGGTPGQASWRS
jgi:hypothetical protein